MMIQKLPFLALTLFFVLATTLPVKAENHLTKADVEQIIQDYLKSNPSVVVDALNEYQKQEQQKQAKQAAEALKNNQDFLYNNPNSPFIGNKNASVTLVEFFDYNCGFCKRALTDINKLVENDPDLKVVFKEFPILSPESETASKMALAAHKQGKYFEFHNALMTAKGRLNEKRMLEIAKEVGLDTDRLQKDAKSDEIAAIVNENREKATALGIRGTPAFAVADQLVSGAVGYDSLKETIDSLRK